MTEQRRVWCRVGNGGLQSVHNWTDTSSFSHFCCAPACALLGLQCLLEISNYSCVGSFMSCRMDICSSVVNSMGCREITCSIIDCRVAWSTSFSSDFIPHRIVSHTFLLTPLSACHFCPFLHTLCQRSHTYGWYPQLCSVIGLLQRRLEQAVSGQDNLWPPPTEVSAAAPTFPKILPPTPSTGHVAEMYLVFHAFCSH